MKRRWPLLLSLLLFLSLTPVMAQNDFEESVTALREGRDREALAACLRLDQAGQSSFGSLYNEGLAYRNLGDIGRARASFERALLLTPYDLDTRRRLRELDNVMGEKVVSRDVLGTPVWKQSQAEVVLLLPGLALLVLALGCRSRGKRPAPTAVLGLTVGGLGLGALIWLTSPAPLRAVVVDGSAQLLPEPEPGKPGEKVPASQLVEVLEQSDHYRKVRLGDDSTGWLRQGQLIELTPPKRDTVQASPQSSASPESAGTP